MTKHSLNADDLVNWEYEGIDFDPRLSEDCEAPSEQLETVKVALESALANIRLAARSFHSFKQKKAQNEV